MLGYAGHLLQKHDRDKAEGTGRHSVHIYLHPYKQVVQRYIRGSVRVGIKVAASEVIASAANQQTRNRKYGQ